MRNTMRAIAINRFGEPETLALQTLTTPEIGPNDVLIHVEIAGVGEWDSFEREGGYAQMLEMNPVFPYVLGSEGAGSVAAVGDQVSRFKPGDQVYALGFLNPKGGFYAEYTAVDASLVSHLLGTLPLDQAGVMGGVGITALRGLDDTLSLQQGETLLIVGAGGGVGHMAVQFAKRMGARVLAVASGEDGVALVERLGADAVIDGRKDDVPAAARAFAPDGFDAALLTAGGDVAQQALSAVRAGGRAAYPNGVQPEPQARPSVRLSGYNGDPDPDIIERLNRIIAPGSFTVHIARTFPLSQAVAAHHALNDHYLGKLALQVS
ncbi:MAG: NADP-dependent oxidoreductase [Chloroflexales bacterium]|nr:NADP-dependent oxidoreductase [Chloroflexales bacterium]